MKKLGIFYLTMLLVVFLSCKKDDENNQNNNATTKTLTLSPGSEDGKDAYLRSLTPNDNYGTHPDLTSEATTNGGNFVCCRGIIDFNLSGIPSNATIIDAKLYLFTYNSPNTGQHTGDNASYLERVTSSWDESTVNWNNQPTTSITNRVTLPKFNNVNQNYVVNITELVKDYFADKSNSFGFMLKLTDETVHKKMIFASSDNTDTSLHPKIVIQYK